MSEAYLGLSRQVQGYLTKRGVPPCEQVLNIRDAIRTEDPRRVDEILALTVLCATYIALERTPPSTVTPARRAIYATQDKYCPPTPKRTFDGIRQAAVNARHTNVR